MASLRRPSTVSQSSLQTLISHREQKTSEPTEIDAFIPKELPPLPHLEDEIAYPPTGTKDPVAHRSLLSNDPTSGPTASIVAGFVVGIIVAISHHLYLTFLNGRNIDEYPQYWVKNANNALSVLFSMCIAFVATCALIQMKWTVARSKPLSIRAIDNLFALPSPSALFATATRLQSPLLLPIFAAIFIQSLALISVFAPNALTVTRSAEVSRDIQVQTLDLSTGRITSIQFGVSYIAPSQIWATFLNSIMLQPPLLNWKIPPGCGATCKFDLVYDGPGLQCMDTPLEPPPYTPKGREILVYNATSTLYPNPRPDPSFSSWEIEDQYELRIGYIATNHSAENTGRDGGSVYCVFRNATYQASFQVENNTMEVNHTIQSYGDILGTVKYGLSDLRCSRNLSEPCGINGMNTRVVCDVFASAFTGKIQFNHSNSSHITEISGGINEAMIDLLFSHSVEDMVHGFHLGVNNLSESLVSLFSNLTLGFIPHRNDTTTVRADIWDGSYAWSYTMWILWAVYLPTLLLASLVILNGLLSIRSNRRGMDDKVSNFLLATKDIELDDVSMDVEDVAKLQQLRLLYHGEKGTFSVASGGLFPK